LRSRPTTHACSGCTQCETLLADSPPDLQACTIMSRDIDSIQAESSRITNEVCAVREGAWSSMHSMVCAGCSQSRAPGACSSMRRSRERLGPPPLQPWTTREVCSSARVLWCIHYVIWCAEQLRRIEGDLVQINKENRQVERVLTDMDKCCGLCLCCPCCK
jgi:hypothetical protein